MTQSSAALVAPKKFHPALVIMHWLTFILIGVEVLLANGGEGEGPRAAADATGGFPIIYVHMILGILILLMLVIRLVVRYTTARPAWASTGSVLLNRIGEITHGILYLLTFGMTITGIILAAQTNRFAALLGQAGTQTRPAFTPGQFPRPGGEFRGEGFRFGLGNLHGLIWAFLVLFILLHIAAALYHQFMLKDNLLKRMSLGDRFQD